MEFIYTAVNKSGEKQKGTVEANSEKEVVEFLRSQNLFPIFVKKNVSEGFFSSLFKPKITSGDIVLFTRQLASMIMTGITLTESLFILRKQTTKPALILLIDDLLANIQEGKSFSQALEAHRDVFSDVYIALVQAAEKGGLLDKILLRLANTLEKNEDLKKHIRSALFYPMIIVVGVIAVVAIMNIFVIPQLATLYQNLDLSLPLSTQIVLGISDITKRLYPLFIALGVGGYFLYKRFARTENGKKTIDKVKLKLPVFGEIIVLSILDNISRTISLLISAGAPVLETLHIAAGVSGNIWYEQALKTAAIQVEKGAPLSTAFENTGMFPVVLIQMAKVGESTGKLDESLEKVAEYFERDLDLKIKTLTTSIEPILIIVLGIAVAFLIISVITPIYSLISQIQ